jgi:hypothetical protein
MICLSIQDGSRIPVLENVLIVRLGDISYSAYLIHFPLIVMWRTLYPHETGLLANVFLIIATLILAIIQTSYFENRIRYQKKVSNVTMLKVVIALVILVSTFGLVGKLTNGFLEFKNSTVSSERRYLLIQSKQSLEKNTFVENSLRAAKGDKEKIILVVGDSMAKDVALAGNLLNSDKYFFYLALDDPCMRVLNNFLNSNEKKIKNVCEQKTDLIRDLVEKSEEIFIAADWSLETYKDGVETAKIFSQIKKVTLVGPLSFDRIVSASYHFALGDKKEGAISNLFYERLNPSKVLIDREFKRELSGKLQIDYFSKLSLFCRLANRDCLATKDNNIFWRDDLHLTLDGARYMGKALIGKDAQ